MHSGIEKGMQNAFCIPFFVFHFYFLEISHHPVHEFLMIKGHTCSQLTKNCMRTFETRATHAVEV